MFPIPFLRREGALPTFLIIGAQKSGTTSLFEHLASHPLVRRPARKEVHYFDKHFSKGPGWYRRQFPRLPPGPLVTGEASPCYLFIHFVPERVRALLPDARLIVILRDPVERAVSQYHHTVRAGRITMSLPDFIKQSLAGDPEREESLTRLFMNYPVQRGYYKDQIERWLRFFPRDQFLFLKFENLASDGAAQVRKVHDFLGLPAVPADTGKIFNSGGGYERTDDSVERVLKDIYRERNGGLDALIGPEFTW